jgi:hypothetical protein
MTPAERLIAQMRAQRLSWVELEPATETAAAKRVQITRPPENDVASFITTADGRLTLEADSTHVGKYVTGWDGILECDLVGPAGSSDPAPFTPELWALVVEDRLGWMRAIARALLDAIVAHQAAQKADEKN